MRTKLRSKVALLFMTLGMLLAVPAVAFAADVVSDVNADLSSNVNAPTWVKANGDKTFEIKVWATGAYNNINNNGRTGEVPVVKNYSTTQDTATSPWKIVAGTQTTDIDTLNFESALVAAGHPIATDDSFNYSQDCTAANFPNGLPQGCPGNPFKVNATLSVGNVPDGTALSLTDAFSTPLSSGFAVITDSTKPNYSLDSGFVKVDARNPTIDLRTPGVDAVYNQNEPVTVDFDCADPGATDSPATGSGIKDSGGCVGTQNDDTTLDTSTPGDYTFTVNAEDKVGNTASVTHNYTVVAPTSYTFNGFFQPVDNKIRNDAKGGSTIPLKFELLKNGVEVTDPAEISSFVQRENCLAGAGDAIEQYSTSASGLRYDTTGGYFIFNWKTPKAPGSCYGVTVSAGSASLSADFGLK
jgi:hypothetical protein